MDKRKLKTLQKNIGYRFKNKDLLIQALTHPSYLQGTNENQKHNQRLEFLGDAVLGMIVADELFKIFPDQREGFLTKARAYICHGKGLTKLAKQMELDDYLLLGKGEQKAKTKSRSQMLGDSLEAIIGAVYMDGGYKPVHKLVLNWLSNEIQNLDIDTVSINYKGELQEWSQSHFADNLFSYSLLEESGPDHAKQFTVAVLLKDQEIARATGYSKKEAEALAAKQTLRELKKKSVKELSTLAN